ncbi:MAG TPA: hypothetical protein VNJ08_13315 [Bacteriovoracaceae bacterium]|nr:hypothetical protein [Bacteriovoracaceae bacterium]
MKINPSDIQSKVVEVWEVKSMKGLSLDQQAILFDKAIHAIEKRALQTLSHVTLMVILDRVLHQSSQICPLFAKAKIESNSLSFEEVHKDPQYTSKERLEAFRYLLVELLRVLGRITADILTAPLHKELLKVAWIDPEKK